MTDPNAGTNRHRVNRRSALPLPVRLAYESRILAVVAQATAEGSGRGVPMATIRAALPELDERRVHSLVERMSRRRQLAWRWGPFGYTKCYSAPPEVDR